MKFKSILIYASVMCVVASAAIGSAKSGTPSHDPFMKTGVRAPQPVGHYDFCKSHPAECGATTSRRKMAPLTEIAWKTIQEVNTAVNRRIVPMTDDDLYGKPELWVVPTTAGDCEDFALLKKSELKARGFQDADLLITVVKKRDGTGHAVLTVRTSEGDFVLDNLDRRVRRWWQTPYRFVKRQSTADAGLWLIIEPFAKDVPVASVDN